MSLAVATNLRDDAGPLPPLQSLDPPTNFTATAADVVAEDPDLSATNATIRARQRPVLSFTANTDSDLPDGFPRRCLFHDIRCPDAETRAAIVRLQFPGSKESLLARALGAFATFGETPGERKKPSTAQVPAWLKLLPAEDLSAKDLRRHPKSSLPKLYGALLKNEQDVQLFYPLAFFGARSAPSCNHLDLNKISCFHFGQNIPRGCGGVKPPLFGTGGCETPALWHGGV